MKKIMLIMALILAMMGTMSAQAVTIEEARDMLPQYAQDGHLPWNQVNSMILAIKNGEYTSFVVPKGITADNVYYYKGTSRVIKDYYCPKDREAWDIYGVTILKSCGNLLKYPPPQPEKPAPIIVPPKPVCPPATLKGPSEVVRCAPPVVAPITNVNTSTNTKLDVKTEFKSNTIVNVSVAAAPQAPVPNFTNNNYNISYPVSYNCTPDRMYSAQMGGNTAPTYYTQPIIGFSTSTPSNVNITNAGNNYNNNAVTSVVSPAINNSINTGSGSVNGSANSTGTGNSAATSK